MRHFMMVLTLIPLWLSAQSLEIKPNRESAVYKTGENASFVLLVKDAQGQTMQEGSLKMRLTNFGPLVITNAVFDLAAANPITLSATLQEPGFILGDASIKVGDKNIQQLFGAAFSPEKIKPGSARPSDFDAFWDAAVKKLDTEVPVDPQIEAMPKISNDKQDSFRVSFATAGGKRVYGFLSVPKGKGPFPVVVNVPGAGPGTVAPSTGLAAQGFVHFVMNVHPFEPAATKTEQKRLYDEQNLRLKEIYGVHYSLSGAREREEYFFYPIILGINRAVNWLAARPDVDKTRFLYTGSSQGGGFGFYLCGLNRNFTKGVMHVPALTDLLGFQQQRASGWPKLVESVPEADKAAATKIAPYFDGAHFAARIKCPVRVSVGFIDRTCPPAAVYSGYNSLVVKDRDICHATRMPHAVYPEVSKPLDQWLKK
ncbi:MAG: acetylxylan esterase [Kiritimatiellia bacterium]